MAIERFTRDNVRDMRGRMQAALDTLKDLGVSFDLGNISYGDVEFHLTVTVRCGAGAAMSAKERKLEEARRDWETYAKLFKLDPSWLGRTFETRGETFTIVGVKPLAEKFPVLAEKKDGRLFKFSAETIIMKLGGKL